MALTLDATAKGASANAYCTRAEADSYHEARLHNEDWDGASNAEKEAAIVWATSLLDTQMDWKGSKTTSAQFLRWPRTGVVDKEGASVDEDTIPQFLINATAEFARLLILEDRTAEQSGDEYEEIRVGPIMLKMRITSKKQLISDIVYDFLKYYGDVYLGRDSMAVKLVRA